MTDLRFDAETILGGQWMWGHVDRGPGHVHRHLGWCLSAGGFTRWIAPCSKSKSASLALILPWEFWWKDVINFQGWILSWSLFHGEVCFLDVETSLPNGLSGLWNQVPWEWVPCWSLRFMTLNRLWLSCAPWPHAYSGDHATLLSNEAVVRNEIE